jgi:hypothetical protein
MNIERLGSGPWPECIMTGSIISLDASGEQMDVDLAPLQGDSPRSVDVMSDGSGLRAVYQVDARYVANILIPAAQYVEVPGETDDDPGIMDQVENLDETTVRLWPVEA